ncbi:MFS transporter [Pseudothauera rhizosphaerae]|uniref:MFS transporter n=1 Tax=Pseudothauera rhizosphaerae TaxID=2565932 RepID=A0A4S4A9T9_9RHOO|nr:MFS transporter [Pseudothauera rhizosphaerae]THF55620.1 MFS transporter [Pseudothauera rhizosphaerae]
MEIAATAAAQETHRTGRQERWLVFALAGIQFSHILDFMVVMPLGPVLMEALAIDARQFALLVSIYTLAAAGSGLAAAGFIDLFGRKGLLLGLFALFCLATLACGLAPDYSTLLLARALAGAFGGVLAAMLQTVIGDAIPFERRARASGAVMAATSLAGVLGVPLSLLVAATFGWQWPFVAIAAVAALFWALAARHVPRLPRHPAGPRPFAGMAAVLRERNHWVALLFMALGAFSTFTVMPYLTLHLVRNVGLGVGDMPLIYALGGLGGFLGARWIGGLADRAGKARIYRLAGLLSIPAILLQTHLPALALGWVLPCAMVFLTLMPARAVPAMAIAISAVPPPVRGTFLSLSAAVQQLACSAAAYAGGLLIAEAADGTLSGYGTAGWLAAALTGATVLLAGRIRMHVRPPGA